MVNETSTTPIQTKYDTLFQKTKWHCTGKIKIQEIEDGGVPMYQDPAREHGYHPTLDIFPTKKKRSTGNH